MMRSHHPGPASVPLGDAGMALSLRAMQQDPVANRMLLSWQDTAVNAILDAIDKLTRQLAAQVPFPDEGSHYDVIQARARARRRQVQVEQCRQLAQDMVLASLHHLADPDWDPFAPPPAEKSDWSAAAPADNLLLMLLDLAQPPG